MAPPTVSTTYSPAYNVYAIPEVTCPQKDPISSLKMNKVIPQESWHLTCWTMLSLSSMKLLKSTAGDHISFWLYRLLLVNSSSLYFVIATLYLKTEYAFSHRPWRNCQGVMLSSCWNMQQLTGHSVCGKQCLFIFILIHIVACLLLKANNHFQANTTKIYYSTHGVQELFLWRESNDCKSASWWAPVQKFPNVASRHKHKTGLTIIY